MTKFLELTKFFLTRKVVFNKVLCSNIYDFLPLLLLFATTFSIHFLYNVWLLIPHLLSLAVRLYYLLPNNNGHIHSEFCWYFTKLLNLTKCPNTKMKCFNIIFFPCRSVVLLALYEVYTYFIHIAMLHILRLLLRVIFIHLHYNFVLRFSWIL